METDVDVGDDADVDDVGDDFDADVGDVGDDVDVDVDADADADARGDNDDGGVVRCQTTSIHRPTIVTIRAILLVKKPNTKVPTLLLRVRVMLFIAAIVL